MTGKGIIGRTGRTIVAMLVVGAIAAPVAQADPWQLEQPSQVGDASDRDGTRSDGSGPIPDAVDRYLAGHPEPVSNGAVQSPAHGEPISDAVDRLAADSRESTPDAVDRYLQSHAPSSVGPSARFVHGDHAERSEGMRFAASAPSADAGSGLEWDVFALGCAVGIVAGALGLGTLVSIRRRNTFAHA
jgi:hypothetical protein